MKGPGRLIYGGAFLLSGLLWTAAMVLFGFYPFGESSILITDMGSQYVEYFAAFTRMIREGTACSSPGIRGWA